MNNFQQQGDTVNLVAPSGGVVSGTAYLIGGLLVVAKVTAAEGVTFAALVTGVVTLPKVSTETWTEGARLYWDVGNARLTSVATAGQLVGVAAGVTVNPSATGPIRLNGTAPALLEGVQAAIADLTAITGGESPTEAEHNAVITALNAVLARLRIVGIIAP